MRLGNERELDTTRNFERTCIPGLAQIDGDDAATGDYAFYMRDHLGSTRGLYDSAKARIGGYQFSPYGHVYAASAFSAATQQYTGHHWDAAAALYSAPYRYYSPTMARWLTRDPLGMVDGPNVYAYVRGNPVITLDILGLESSSSYDCSIPGPQRYEICERGPWWGRKFCKKQVDRACRLGKPVCCQADLLKCKGCSCEDSYTPEHIAAACHSRYLRCLIDGKPFPPLPDRKDTE